MTMPSLAFGLVLGVSLAVIYFACLWATTQRVVRSARPVRLLCISFAIRGTALLAGLYWLANGDALRLVGVLVGVVLIRTLLITVAQRQIGTRERLP